MDKNSSELDEVNLELRRFKSFELKKAGFDYRTIGVELKVSPQTAMRDVKHVLGLVQPDEQEIEDFRKMEIARLEGYLVNIRSLIQAGDSQAINTATRIDARIAALKGLDVSKMEVTGRGGSPLIISEIVVNVKRIEEIKKGE